MSPQQNDGSRASVLPTAILALASAIGTFAGIYAGNAVMKSDIAELQKLVAQNSGDIARTNETAKKLADTVAKDHAELMRSKGRK